MKVLFFTNYPSPYRVDFFNQFGKACDLTVLFFEGTEEQTHRNQKWFENRFINFNAVFLNRKIRIMGKTICLDIIDYIKKDWDHIISGSYDSPTQVLAIEWMNLHRKKFIIESDGGFVKNDNVIKGMLKRHLISSANAWISTGKYTTDYLVHYGAKREKTYEYTFTSLWKKDIDRAFELSNNDKEIIRKKMNLQEAHIIISVGRFSYERGYGKGFDLLMDIAHKFDGNVGFYIIGDNPTDEFERRKAREGLDNVHFVGFQRKEELSMYYAAADVFVLMTREDVWGLVINEAMSFGLPIVTTDKCVAGLTLVQDGINGFIIKNLNTDEAYVKLRTLLDDAELRRRFGQNSLSIINDYTVENMTVGHMMILERVWGGVREVVRNMYKDKIKVKGFVILTVGQVIYRKGIDILLQSLVSLKGNWSLYIIGGLPNEQLNAIINKNTFANVKFIEFMDKKGLRDYYLAADLFILPTREDVWGLVINEAMSYGLPIITTKKCIAGLTLVDETNGRIIKEEDPESLSNAIMNMIEDENRLLKGVASYGRIQLYNIENMAASHIKILERMK